LNPSLVLKVIPAINGGRLSLDEFALATGLGNNVSNELLAFLARNGVGVLDPDHVDFEPLDRMRAAILAVRIGAGLEELSRVLDWKDFEVLAAKMLEASGYTTHHAFRLRKPRAEVDVIGIRDGLALLVDCKHWKRASPSELRRFASMQTERAQAFVGANKKIGNEIVLKAVPAILTLHSESVDFADGVPVIPVTKFRSFLNEMPGYLDRMRLVSAV